jgi:AcrR family transcriptional regulator
VVAQHGFHQASVGQIAEHAGYSIGALYGNFRGKDELFLSVFDRHLDWFGKQLRRAAARKDAGQAGAAWLRVLAREPDQFLVFVEFWAYAVRKPALRLEFAKRMRQMREAIREAIEARADLSDAEPPVDPQLAALVVLALGRGLAIERLADPKAVSEKEVGNLLRLLVP